MEYSVGRQLFIDLEPPSRRRSMKLPPTLHSANPKRMPSKIVACDMFRVVKKGVMLVTHLEPIEPTRYLYAQPGIRKGGESLLDL